MASDTRNVKLGVCSISYDGVDLGYTQGGVEVTVATETHKVEVDQFGKSPINEQIMSRSAMVKAPLAESTLENIVATMPGSVLVTDTLKKRVDVSHAIGTNLLDLARVLILHPIANAATARNDDFNLLLAATAGAMQFAFKLEEERILNVEFSGYPSAASKKLFSVGDLTAGAVAATIDFTTDVITATSHGLTTGQAVTFDATTFPALSSPAGVVMALGKTFFASKIDANTFKIHPTPTDAINNTNPVNFTDAGTAVKLIAI